MDSVLRAELNDESLKCLGGSGGGCICEALTYQAGDGGKIFVKMNNKSKAREMFDGEFKSLHCLHDVGIVQVPKPIKVIDIPEGGAVLVMEHIQINGLSTEAGALGELMARLHLHNSQLKKREEKQEKYVGKSETGKTVNEFGFDLTTCCGYIPQDNTWCKDWVTFFSRKLQTQMNLIEKDYGDREAKEMWSELQLKLSKFFEGLDIVPSLLHGDLWGGNVGQNSKGPVIFDPACFYGHSEFDLAIAKMFGGFSSAFFDNYHKVNPQEQGFAKRLDLYKLFHYLNHWNHFGTSYRDSSISSFKKALR